MSDLTSSVGALTTTFTPTVTSCSSVYIQDNSAGGYFLKFGTVGVASTSSCFPPNFAPLGYYSPGVCPDGYWNACQAGIDKTATVATCCPQDYTCKKDRATDDLHQCQSKFEQVSWISVSQCYTKSGTPELPCGRFVTTTYTSGDHIFAYGINIRRAGSDPAWSGASTDPTAAVASTAGPTGTRGSTDTAPANTNPSSHTGDGANLQPSIISTPAQESGLSSSAKIGIGVGVALGVLLVIGAIFAAYLIGKRGRRRREEEEKEAQQQTQPRDQAYIAPETQGEEWKGPPGQAAELGPSGYDGSTTYGSGYSQHQHFGVNNSNTSPWAYEMGPSERGPVEMGSSEPISSELASHEHKSRGVSTTLGPWRHQ
ncbi:hypothetical protein PGQ11_009027 [Apiospora arundinis]|uniref:Uncharacterized protein n=1 Tax=Apiospora arundinis TaxID=335852 RepID=A0ABR2IGU2_9PEZI